MHQFVGRETDEPFFSHLLANLCVFSKPRTVEATKFAFSAYSVLSFFLLFLIFSSPRFPPRLRASAVSRLLPRPAIPVTRFQNISKHLCRKHLASGSLISAPSFLE